MAGLKDLRDKLQLSDPLGYDLLRGEPMKDVATKRDDIGGLSLYDNEYAAAKQLKDQASNQQSALQQYKKDFATSMQDSNAKANELITNAQKEAYGDLVSIYVVDPSGNNREGPYHLPKSVAEGIANAKGLSSSWSNNGKEFNVSSRVEGGRIRGQELHDELRKAEQEMRDNDPTRDLKKQIDSQRGIAQREYEQNVELATKTIQESAASYQSWLTQKKQAFQQGIQTNRGGIANLVNSGALILKPTVSQ